MGTPHTTTTHGGHRPLVIVTDPVGLPNPALVVAAARADAVGLLDLRRHVVDDDVLARTGRVEAALVGVRLALGAPTAPEGPQGPVVVDARAATAEAVTTGLAALAPAVDGRTLLVEVTDRDAAVAAVAAGATGVVAVGSEAGGRIGDVESSILLQQVRADLDESVPVWCWGGIGLHSAAAAVAGGATGVVLDGQLALVRESLLDDEAARRGDRDGRQRDPRRGRPPALHPARPRGGHPARRHHARGGGGPPRPRPARRPAPARRRRCRGDRLRPPLRHRRRGGPGGDARPSRRTSRRPAPTSRWRRAMASAPATAPATRWPRAP